MTRKKTRPENDLTQQTLEEIFNESGRRHHKTFRKKLANLFISFRDKQVYVADDVAEVIARNTGEVKKMIADCIEHLNMMGAVGNVSKSDIAGTPIRHMSLMGRPEPLFVSGDHADEMNLIGLFDHEMAHLIIEEAEGPPYGHKTECTADAYAVLRHLQRFGDTTDIFEFAPAMGAAAAIFYSPQHYTGAVIQKIESLVKEGNIDIQSLSLEETARLAAKIGTEYALSELELAEIWDAYDAAGKLYKEEKTDWAATIKAIVGVMLEYKDDDHVYRAGKLFISRPDAKDIIADKLSSDPEFQDMAARMEQHEKDSGFILNAADAMDAARAAKRKAPAAAQKRHLGQ
jgi:hypothetical protein